MYYEYPSISPFHLGVLIYSTTPHPPEAIYIDYIFDPTDICIIIIIIIIIYYQCCVRNFSSFRQRDMSTEVAAKPTIIVGGVYTRTYHA